MTRYMNAIVMKLIKKKHLVISSERGGLERSILSSAEVDPKIRKFSIKKVVDVSS